MKENWLGHSAAPAIAPCRKPVDCVAGFVPLRQATSLIPQNSLFLKMESGNRWCRRTRFVNKRRRRDLHFMHDGEVKEDGERGWMLSNLPHPRPPPSLLFNSESLAQRLFLSLALLVIRECCVLCVPQVYSSLLLPRWCFFSFHLCALTFRRRMLLFLTLLCFYCPALCVFRIWWMISAKSSSWRWATWMEARITEPGAEEACRSGAAESPLLEPTGEEVHALTSAGTNLFMYVPLKVLSQTVNSHVCLLCNCVFPCVSIFDTRYFRE